MHSAKKIALLVFMALLLFACIGLTVYADDEESLPDAEEYLEDVIDAMPSEVEALLPEADSYDTLAEEADTEYLLSLSLYFLKEILASFLQDLSILMTFVLFASVACRIEDSFEETRDGLASFVVILVVGFQLFSRLRDMYDQTLSFCESVSAYMLTLNGVMGSVSILGGGTAEASVRSVALSAVISLLGSTVTTLLLPIVRLSFALAITSSLSSRLRLSSVASFFRNAFTFLLGFLATVSVVALTFQTALAQAEDTLAARSLRFAAGSSIPYVGGALSDSMRTLSASVSLIKSSVGTVGTVGLFLTVLYPLSALVSYKLSLSFAKSAAGVMGADSVELIMDEAGKLINMMIACQVILFSLYIFVIALFSLSASPLE